MDLLPLKFNIESNLSLTLILGKANIPLPRNFTIIPTPHSRKISSNENSNLNIWDTDPLDDSTISHKNPKDIVLWVELFSYDKSNMSDIEMKAILKDDVE